LDRIAKNSHEFLQKVSNAIIESLNTSAGQEITDELLGNALKENPGMTVKEWNRIKEGFVVFIFSEFLDEFPDVKAEFSEHIYNDLRAKEES